MVFLLLDKKFLQLKKLFYIFTYKFLKKDSRNKSPFYFILFYFFVSAIHLRKSPQLDPQIMFKR